MTGKLCPVPFSSDELYRHMCHCACPVASGYTFNAGMDVKLGKNISCAALGTSTAISFMQTSTLTVSDRKDATVPQLHLLTASVSISMCVYGV